jgi:hypothetical protein
MVDIDLSGNMFDNLFWQVVELTIHVLIAVKKNDPVGVSSEGIS